MRNLILSSGLLAAALIGGPQAAVAQNEYPFCARNPGGGLNCVYNSIEQCRQAGGDCMANPATTGQVPPTQSLPGGGQFLPGPGQPPATRGEGAATPLPPAGGGQFLPPPR